MSEHDYIDREAERATAEELRAMRLAGLESDASPEPSPSRPVSRKLSDPATAPDEASTRRHGDTGGRLRSDDEDPIPS